MPADMPGRVPLRCQMQALKVASFPVFAYHGLYPLQNQELQVINDAQVLRDAAATSAVRVARAEALRELGRLLLEAAAMHREVSGATGAGTEVRALNGLTSRPVIVSSHTCRPAIMLLLCKRRTCFVGGTTGECVFKLTYGT